MDSAGRFPGSSRGPAGVRRIPGSSDVAEYGLPHRLTTVGSRNRQGHKHEAPTPLEGPEMESDSREPEPCATCADLRARRLHALRLAMALRDRVKVAVTPMARRDFSTWSRGYRALAFADRAHRVVAHRG